jgi:hypothetical protein
MSHTKFKYVNDINQKTVSEIIEDNMVMLMDWGFTDIGGYFNVDIPTSGHYGGDMSNLKPEKDYRYSPTNSETRVWSSHRENWVWESGLQKGTPINISGVYVSGIFSETSGSIPHYYDYKHGRVVFDSAQDINNTVELAYSHKWVSVEPSENVTFFRQVQPESNRIDRSHFSQYGSGDWNVNPENRVQLPMIAVEVPPMNRQTPWELGSGAKKTEHLILFHVLAENENHAKRISDIIGQQSHSTYFLFDSNEVAKSGDFPLDHRGMISSRKTYPQLTALNSDGGYRWHRIRFMDSHGQNGKYLHHNLYLRTVRMNTEVILCPNSQFGV